ncbi:hypothetical protein K8R30_02830 [archaeon]|nr:hypothetical protein [archaeon]
MMFLVMIATVIVIKMSEIDDNYVQRGEDSDLKFFEEMKNGAERKVAVEKFLGRSGKSRREFEADYAKFLRKEKRRVSIVKKKKDKKVKFDRLKAWHFDFRFGFFERKKMKVDVLWFNFVRKFWKYWNLIIPKWAFYVYYKVTGFIKNVFVETKDFIWDATFWAKDFVMGVLGGAWFLMKKGYRMLSVVLGKIMFWRKKKVVVEGEGDKEKKGEGDKEGD